MCPEGFYSEAFVIFPGDRGISRYYKQCFFCEKLLAPRVFNASINGVECVYDGQGKYNFLYFSPTRADGAECVYDGQQAREHTTVAELALA